MVRCIDEGANWSVTQNANKATCSQNGPNLCGSPLCLGEEEHAHEGTQASPHIREKETYCIEPPVKFVAACLLVDGTCQRCSFSKGPDAIPLTSAALPKRAWQD
jgi:hypothetical protein